MSTRSFVMRALQSTPISFRIDGRDSREFLLECGCTTRQCSDDRGVHTTTAYADPGHRIEVRCAATELSDFPAAEFVAYLTNTGDCDTPLIEDVQSLDTALELEPGGSCTLRYARGGIWADRAFEPLAKVFGPGDSIALTPRRETGVAPTDYAPAAGLSSCPYLPFLNMDLGSSGLILALGWTGQWAVDLRRTSADKLLIRAGLERSRFVLRPGETVRLPRVLLLDWRGEYIDGQNVFRQLLLKHYTPQQDGRHVEAPVSFTGWGAEPTSSHLEKIAMIRREGLPVDWIWIDGGWTVGNKPWDLGLDTDSVPVWSQNVGNWSPSEAIYPDGIRPVGDAARAAGMKLVLWLEAVRAYEGSEVATAHPEWMLSPGPETPELFAGSKLVDVSIPEAAEWFVNLICRKLDETGADHQWNDFCIDDPLSYWRKDEPTDRQGIREAAWVTAYLRCWEEIMRRRPGTLIVNCAGGARQVDLDTMALSLPLWTSDYQAVPHISGETATGDQCHSFGSLFWLPISATAAMRPDTLCFRSNMRASVNVRWWLNRKLPEEPPIDWLRQMLEQHRLVRKYYYGEFYPLTEYSLAEDVWMAYQMHRPDLDEGMVLAFRRMDSDEPQRAFVLHRLSADRAYSVRDLDGDTEFEVPGRALVSEGLRVRISDRPCSRLLVYRGI